MVTQQKLITFRNGSYTANWPKIGQMMEIEGFKLAITNNRYADMYLSGMKMNAFLLDVADTAAHFSVLLPDLGKDLKITNWREVDSDLMKELVTVYKEQFHPWYKELYDKLVNWEVKSDKDGEESEENAS